MLEDIVYVAFHHVNGVRSNLLETEGYLVLLSGSFCNTPGIYIIWDEKQCADTDLTVC